MHTHTLPIPLCAKGHNHVTINSFPFPLRPRNSLCWFSVRVQSVNLSAEYITNLFPDSGKLHVKLLTVNHSNHHLLKHNGEDLLSGDAHVTLVRRVSATLSSKLSGGGTASVRQRHGLWAGSLFINPHSPHSMHWRWRSNIYCGLFLESMTKNSGTIARTPVIWPRKAVTLREKYRKWQRTVSCFGRRPRWRSKSFPSCSMEHIDFPMGPILLKNNLISINLVVLHHILHRNCTPFFANPFFTKLGFQNPFQIIYLLFNCFILWLCFHSYSSLLLSWNKCKDAFFVRRIAWLIAQTDHD